MKISICVPQYNRINFLLQSLDLITQQTYADIEVVISDDCSTDNTEEAITALQSTYKYPLVYFRNKANKGYDFMDYLVDFKMFFTTYVLRGIPINKIPRFLPHL